MQSLMHITHMLIPFTTKTPLNLLMSAFFVKNQIFFVKNSTFTQSIRIRGVLEIL